MITYSTYTQYGFIISYNGIQIGRIIQNDNDRYVIILKGFQFEWMTLLLNDEALSSNFCLETLKEDFNRFFIDIKSSFIPI